jgi:hypothetical protein
MTYDQSSKKLLFENKREIVCERSDFISGKRQQTNYDLKEISQRFKKISILQIWSWKKTQQRARTS